MDHGNRIVSIIIITILSVLLQACGSNDIKDDDKKASAPVIVFDDKDTISFDTVSQEPEADTVSDDEAGDGYNSELKDKHVKLTLTDDGTDVFTPRDDGNQDYRYSPSLMLDDDGGIDAWFAAPGDGEDEYDWVTMRRLY